MSPQSGLLATNVMHFARLLRRTGLPVGPAETIAAVQALTFIDIGQRSAVQAALRAVMVHRHEHFEMFDQAFALFWRNPDASRFAAALAAMDGMRAPDEERAPPGARRLAEAMAATKDKPPREDTPPQTIDATLTFSELEKLQAMDFEAMSAADITRAKTEITKLRLPLDARRTRRWQPDAAGRRQDLKATIRNSMRTGGEIVALARASQKIKPPPLVVLCDISGSMARYAQILLHFLHSVANDRDRVSVFLFGTRLSNISRQLRHRDPEVAFQMVSSLVPDWSGGTRIGEALAAFNRTWSRRVLGQGAVVLLVTDGLDRDGAHGLAANMERLHRSCRRLIWLNPLLRWDGFSPKTQGAKAMLPYVDEFRPVHNLASLSTLIASLSAPPPPRGQAAQAWKEAS
ncbi:MAG: VWA domain-containing protein [Acidocella sp. 20-57-95]|nr:MAG: VWA domain-containing protein [Acidocella sp. 20-57-95]HQT65101.1 VWA domain-containing protein [Acidocella sp.]